MDNLDNHPSIGTGGSRIWFYPKEMIGRFYRSRRIVAWGLAAFYIVLPWLQFKDLPVVQLDVIERKIILMGNFFWPEDLGIFLPLIIASVITVFLVTSVLGRIWCGWACPQTVFLHFIFEPVERLLEGKSTHRKKRDDQPFSADWLWRKALKHFIFLFFAIAAANTFLSYFLGTDVVLKAILSPPSLNPVAFAVNMIFIAFFYINFAWFKEQACILVCPYARFQTVLTDENTLNVCYDFSRGEKRAPLAKNRSENSGDCVDCRKCMRVCPTGIDIRDGIQLECIGCAKCIDACNSVMNKVKKPLGLIRYTSVNQLENRGKKILRPRVYLYSGLVVLLLVIHIILLSTRSYIGLDIKRASSIPYFLTDNDSVMNIVSLTVRNKLPEPAEFKLEVPPEYQSSHNWLGKTISVNAGKTGTFPVNITSPSGLFQFGRKNIIIKVTNGREYESKSLILAGPYAKTEKDN